MLPDVLQAATHSCETMRRSRRRRTTHSGLLGFLWSLKPIRLFALATLALAIVALVELSVLVAVLGVAHLALARGLFVVVYAVTLVSLLVTWRRYAARRRLRARTLGELLLLTPAQFEHSIANLLVDLGFKGVRRTGKAGDLGVDILCRDGQGQSVAVQCKRYAPGARVGSQDIQTFIGMIAVHHGADRGIFVTTAGYTRPAIDLANQHQIRVIDGQELARLADEIHQNAVAKNRHNDLLP